MKKTIATLTLAGLLGAYVVGQGIAQTAPAAKAPAAKAPAAKAAPKAAPVQKGPSATAVTPGPDFRPPVPYRAGPRVGTHPDLSGVWSVQNTANWDLEPHAARSALQMRDGPIVRVPAKDVVKLGALVAVPAGMGFVEGGAIPYKPEALATRNENRENYVDRDPEVRCYLPGIPRANYMALPFQIFQSDKAMMFAYEYAGAARNVLYTDPGPAPIDSWMGQSVAKWEGETLVITVTGMSDRTWFDRSGNHHSDQLKVVERWTLISPTTMRYIAEITDPEVFTRPWRISMIMYKHVGEDARLQQFKCVEFVEELIYGHLRKDPLK